MRFVCRPLRQVGVTILLLAMVVWHAEAVAGQLSVSWVDPYNDQLGFSVERGIGTAGPFGGIGTTAAGVTTYTDTSVSAGTTYCYRVRAFNTAGYSDYSNVACGASVQMFGLAVVKMGAGSGTVTSSPVGIICGTSCSGTYPNGTVVTLTAVPAAGSTFTGWSGGGCSGTGSCTVTLTATTTVTASFEVQSVSLTVSKGGTGGGTITSSPAGIACGATCSGSYASGTAVTLSAAPASGTSFTGWSGGGCSGTGSCTVTLTATATVTATFTASPTTFALAVTKAGTGGGAVTSSPTAINCGTTCSASFASGTVVTLTATPALGSTFAGWSGACSGSAGCSVTMNAASAVTATFNVSTSTFALSVTKAGTGSGTVTSSPASINCGTLCSATFNNGTSVTLTAAPAAGSIFAGWSGPCSGTNSCTVATNINTGVTATFNIPASLTVSPTSVASGGSVTATWTRIATPSPTDWIGLYTPGSPDTAFLAWSYVSCSKTPTTAKAFGSCPFVLPNPLAPATYELRLLSNNVFIRLATSNAFFVTTTTNSAPAAPSNLGQFRADAVTALALGATVPETSVVLKTTVTDPDATQTVKLQLEVRPLGTAFSNTPTHESPLLASGSLAAVTVATLTPGTSYHWQARAVDNLGATSPWVPFGANPETAADFAVAATTSTTLTATPTSAAPGGSVTATWTGIATPGPTDWIGLYTPGSPDTAFLAWSYVSCSKTPTTAKASGSCPFVLPNPLASATYELRLFANNVFTRLATSSPLTVP